MKPRKESLVLMTLSLLVLIPVESACAEYILDYPTDRWASLNGDVLRIVDGGELGLLFSMDSTLIIEGGYLNEGHIDNTEVTILGGSIYDLYGRGNVTVSGGDIWDLSVHGTLNVTGGVIRSVHIDEGSSSISGGQVGFATSQGANGVLSIEGGDIGRVIATNYGEVHIFDQVFEVGMAHIWGKLFIYAERFILDGEAMANGRLFEEGSSSHILEYFLSDGSSVVANIDLQAYGELILIPEPATLLLFGIGAVLLRGRRRV